MDNQKCNTIVVEPKKKTTKKKVKVSPPSFSIERGEFKITFD